MGNQLVAADQAAWQLVESARPQFLGLLGIEDEVKAQAIFQREAAFAVQVLAAGGPEGYALKVARANPQSVQNAVVNVAAIGITLNPAKKQAYLVPRDGRICLDISYRGLIDLATESGAIRWAQADVVCAGETFRLQGIDKAPIHDHDPFSRDFDNIRGVYVVVKTADGDFLTHTMGIQEVWDIRDRSSAWRAWLKDKKKCPWVTDEVQMIVKTCIKQAEKTWPRDKTDERLARAIQYLNTDGGEGLDDLAGSGGDEPQATVQMPTRRSAGSGGAAPSSSPAAAPTNTTISPTAAASPAPATERAATQGEKAHIKAKAGDRLGELLQRCGVANFEQLTASQFTKLRAGLRELA